MRATRRAAVNPQVRNSKIEIRNSALPFPAERANGSAPAASHPSATGMAQTSSCEVSDVPKGQAGTENSNQPVTEEQGGVLEEKRTITSVTAATAAVLVWIGAVLAVTFTNIKNRGNELKELLQRQGITEIAASKRTHFRAEETAPIAVERGGIRRLSRLADCRDNFAPHRSLRPACFIYISGAAPGGEAYTEKLFTPVQLCGRSVWSMF